jgi:hypothetical protein
MTVLQEEEKNVSGERGTGVKDSPIPIEGQRT